MMRRLAPVTPLAACPAETGAQHRTTQQIALARHAEEPSPVDLSRSAPNIPEAASSTRSAAGSNLPQLVGGQRRAHSGALTQPASLLARVLIDQCRFRATCLAWFDRPYSRYGISVARALAQSWPMDRPRSWFRVPSQVVPPALLLAIFIFDLFTPLGVAVWVLYLVPLGATYRSAGRRASYLVAAGGTALILLAHFGSSPGIDWRIAAVNRAMMVAALWASALYLAWLKESIAAHTSAESRLRAAHRALEASERHLRAILEAEPACVKLMTADGRLLEMNRAGLANVGADRLDDLWHSPGASGRASPAPWSSN